MRCYHIEARDLPDAWFQAIDLCYIEGRDYKITEGSYAGQKRRELDYVTIHITHPHTEPLLPELPEHMIAAGIPNPVPTGMDYVHEYLPYLLTADIKPGEQYTYGSRLFGITDDVPEQIPEGFVNRCQVDEVIAKFKRGFGNNQACITIAQPSDIHLSDPPCLRQIDCRIYPRTEEDRYRSYPQMDEAQLHFCIYFRSWDLWGGLPPNLAAVVHLQQYMADEIGVEPGELIAASKGLHLYDHFWRLAQIRLGEKER